MTIESQLQSLSSKLEASADEKAIIQDKLSTLQDLLEGHDYYTVANILRTTPVTKESTAGVKNQFDAMSLIHTSVSERELAEMFYEQLSELTTSDFINKSVMIQLDGLALNVVPAKFAQQGTIEIDDKEFPLFADITGLGELLQDASRLLQQWQAEAGLDLEKQALLPSEIEVTLAHIIKEGEPESLLDLVQMFFKFGKADRFAGQLNIFDRHGNILLYHNFTIPDKQVFLEKLFDAHDRIVSDEPDLSIFGF